MSVILVILAVILLALAYVLLFEREAVAPVSAFLGMACCYAASCLPLNANILLTWLCLTVIVTGVSLMQPRAVMQQRRGMGYITVGSLAGLAVGLLGFSVTTRLGAVWFWEWWQAYSSATIYLRVLPEAGLSACHRATSSPICWPRGFLWP